jgi:hypothetical protein
MLNYGAYAQQYFDADVEAEDLANVNHPYSAGEFTVATNALGSYVPTVPIIVLLWIMWALP